MTMWNHFRTRLQTLRVSWPLLLVLILKLPSHMMTLADCSLFFCLFSSLFSLLDAVIAEINQTSYSSMYDSFSALPKNFPVALWGFFSSHFKNMVFPDIPSKIWRIECVCFIVTNSELKIVCGEGWLRSPPPPPPLYYTFGHKVRHAGRPAPTLVFYHYHRTHSNPHVFTLWYQAVCC